MSPYFREDFSKLSDRMEKIEKSISRQSVVEKEKFDNKLELVYDIIKGLQGKIDDFKHTALHHITNEVKNEVFSEQSLLNNIPS
jgi:DNA-binding XRE family transcriptional regulator